jgi:hypothetical protein
LSTIGRWNCSLLYWLPIGSDVAADLLPLNAPGFG